MGGFTKSAIKPLPLGMGIKAQKSEEFFILFY
jgi:hypothetical protein